jgi:D-proline reductase (dithiol) PrdB
LVAREIEPRGIATICLSSAYSITAAVNPPRAVFLDFPLGHTAGKRGDKALQRRIMIDTLSALDGIQQPGRIHHLHYRWSESAAWKEHVMRPGDGGRASADDDRATRLAEPQYQYPEDREAAEANLRRR